MLSREPGKAGRLSAPLERGQGHNGVKPAYLPGQGQLQLRAADLGEPPSPGGKASSHRGVSVGPGTWGPRVCFFIMEFFV